jgi:hypothetical protein
MDFERAFFVCLSFKIKIDMRILYTIFILLCFQTLIYSQYLILPADVTIKEPKMKLFQETSLTPLMGQFTGGELFRDRMTYYSDLVSENLNEWIKEEESGSVIYTSQDSTVNINKLKGLIIREISVYESLKSKPIFGYGGIKPVEGANTKEYLNILREEYGVKYVIYVFANSLHAEGTFKKHEFPHYKGHTFFYGVVLDTETGYIEIIKEVKDKQYPDLGNKKNALISIDSYRPIFHIVDDEYMLKRCKKLQGKLKKKMNQLD